MKKVILIFLAISMIYLVSALADDSSLVRTTVHVVFDRNSPNEAVLTISGENLNWAKTIRYNDTIKDNETGEVYGMPDTFSIDLEILMIREFGNYTDILYVISECNEMANFSRQWEICRDQREELIIRTMNEMINITTYEEDISNATSEKDEWKGKYETETSTLSSEINKLKEENEKLNSDKRNGWLVGIIGIAGAGYCLVRYRGWGKRKQQIESELSRDVNV